MPGGLPTQLTGAIRMTFDCLACPGWPPELVVLLQPGSGVTVTLSPKDLADGCREGVPARAPESESVQQATVVDGAVESRGHSATGEMQRLQGVFEDWRRIYTRWARRCFALDAPNI